MKVLEGGVTLAKGFMAASAQAGKTTILDAMVFALYDEASSGQNKKEGVIFQSQYVDLDITPEVTLEFAESGAENAPHYHSL